MSDMPKVVAAVPGQGWVARYRMDDGTLMSCPVVAWLVYADGTVSAVDGSSDNFQDGAVHQNNNFVDLVPPGGWADPVPEPKETKP